MAGFGAGLERTNDTVHHPTPLMHTCARPPVRPSARSRQPVMPFGTATRAAVKAMQLKLGIPADPYPTPELLEWLRTVR